MFSRPRYPILQIHRLCAEVEGKFVVAPSEALFPVTLEEFLRIRKEYKAIGNENKVMLMDQAALKRVQSAIPSAKSIKAIEYQVVLEELFQALPESFNEKHAESCMKLNQDV